MKWLEARLINSYSDLYLISWRHFICDTFQEQSFIIYDT